MADDKKPTEEQVQAANAAEEARWQDDFPDEDLAIPYSNDDEDEPADEDKPSDDEDESDENDDEDYEEDYLPPAPVSTEEDPGEFQPGDHSFVAMLADGKQVTVTNPEEADRIAADPENFKTPKELMDFMTKFGKMERAIAREKEQWQDKKDKFEAGKEAEEERMKVVQNIAAEFKYLVEQGELPPVAAKYRNADWSDPEVAKQPGVKEQKELMNFMVKENEKRQKAGVRVFTSVLDAHNAFKIAQARKESNKQGKESAEARKRAGARISAPSAPGQAPYVPKGIAVGNPNVFKRGNSQWTE